MFPQIHYIFDELKRRNLFLVTAESLTGGLIAKYITDVPGASAVFWGGWVTYSAEAKRRLLNVSTEILERFGVVSVETATAMAKGDCIRFLEQVRLCNCSNRISGTFRRYSATASRHGMYRLCD